MSVFFDITRPLHPQIPVWPGDRELTLEHPAKLADGDAANVGHLHLSLHTGTHVDAPFHFVDGAVTIDEIPIDAYVGPAQVIDMITSSKLPRHHLFNDAGLLILENLLLDAVQPGVYELIALPLRLKGGDGSPVRAVLRG